jgi:hypothetical protein
MRGKVFVIIELATVALLIAGFVLVFLMFWGTMT